MLQRQFHFKDYEGKTCFYQRHISTNRQATQHGCLGDEDKGIEIVYGEEKHILYWTD